ncbi:toxic anion resistance protein [uncultured Methanobrevibacter sp.]|uniref:toxic anion resistance protein n=1 Tax=uncultured Methanobrevibacter sp. TaxID=253161 RepID=UPI0025D2817A|nr:toxic anion resistance protein [uncultured Methanobrevibacter sp.]
MAEFSLDVQEIQEDVEKSLKEQEESLPNDEIKKQADDNAEAIFEANFDDVAARENILKPLDDFGLNAINRSANKNNLLNARFKDLAKGGDEAVNVGNKLEELDKEIRNLDPASIEFGKSGFLGKLLKPIRNYFDKYEQADEAINNILVSLDASSKVLQNDNTTLLAEESYLRELTKKLMADIELGKQMDASIEQQIRQAEINGVDQYKIDFVREEVLFPLRQRIMDMQQMIVVNQQGIISLNVVRRNNKELIRGVSRAKNVTVTALRNGIMVASALYNQQVVIKKIQALNTTTEQVIESTSRMLREQGNQIQKQSAETMISPEVLKQSFEEALAAIEDVSNYKNQALPKMQEQITAFSQMAEEGQRVVDKIETK